VWLDAGGGTRRKVMPVMGTIVTIDVPPHALVPAESPDGELAVARAFNWFSEVERRCSRFDPESELQQLSRSAGTPVVPSLLVRELLRFTLALAADTGGAFDPTVGHQLERRGFNINHRTQSRIATPMADDGASYRDVILDDASGTVTLLRPLVLDLGAAAKGLAIDLAAHELAPLRHFVVDAGGDLYLGGTREDGRPWNVGVRHPLYDDHLLTSTEASNCAVCTSGNYERRPSTRREAKHIIDPRCGDDADTLSSVTVIAPSALLADAVATAAFVLGPHKGAALIERHGCRGLLFTPDFLPVQDPADTEARQ
jgi:thiamine biosynthesis lipoprotein